MSDQLLPPEYQTLTQGSTSGLDLSFIAPLLWTSAIVTILLTVVFLLYFIYVIIRRRKVENATLEMRDDIRRMRELMEKGSSVPPSTPKLATSDNPQSVVTRD